MYPDYALAWSELGAARQRQGKLEEAASAYRRASAADPKYIKPYVQLAALAAQQGHWADAVTAAERALELHPVEFPGAFFYHAVACYNLGRLGCAEESARRAIETDTHHEFPRAHYLLGSVLLGNGDRPGAIEEFRRYLALEPRAADAAEVRALIGSKTLLQRQ